MQMLIGFVVREILLQTCGFILCLSLLTFPMNTGNTDKLIRRFYMTFSRLIKGIMILAVCTLPFSVGALLQEEPATHTDHRQMMSGSSPLTMPGNMLFGTIQEVIRQLEADTNTDWTKVDLEALRQHLIDMHHFTMNVEVVSKSPIADGVKIVIEPTVPEATPSLQRALQAHPPMLRMEKGWTMDVTENGDQFTLEVTTGDPGEIAKVRGLGYIGLMATGAHHTKHHWSIARGMNPHSGTE